MPSEKKSLDRILAAALLAMIAVSFYLVSVACLRQTEGHFTYALDDPYIHLAIAKNFAYHGVWGVTEYANTSACSSPLWVLLLALAIRLGGDSIFWPLVFGMVCSAAVTLLIYWRLVRSGLGAPLAFIASSGIFALGPLHVLPFTGMEHSLQILLDLLFGFWLLDIMGRPAGTKDVAVAIGLTCLMCLCRYESVFLLVVPALWTLSRRDWRLAAAIMLGPILAIGGFGLISHLNGMPWIPNSIILKGNHPTSAAALLMRTFRFLHSESLALWDLFVLNVFAGIALRIRGIRETTGALQMWLWTVVVACVFHAALATVGIFFRYEAYLLVLLATVFLLAFRELFAHHWPSADAIISKRNWLIGIGVVCLGQFVLSSVFWFYQLNANLIILIYAIGLILLVGMETGTRTRGRFAKVLMASLIPIALVFTVRDRATAASTEIADGSRDIYLQQFQMARFVSRYYPTGRLGANDIGAVTYFTHVHLLDLVGLASDNIRKLKTSHTFSTKTIGVEMAAFNPDLVIAYPDWFTGPESLPSTLIPVAKWVIPPVTTAAGSMVTFYAWSSPAAERLHRELIEFQPSLPSQVKVDYVEPNR